MKHKTLAHAIILAGFVLMARKTFIVSILGLGANGIWDTSIQVGAGLLMGLGCLILNKACRGGAESA